MRARLAAVLVVGACGHTSSGTPDAAPGGGDGSGSQVDAGDGYRLLVEREWQVASGDEYQCRHVRVNEDMYITGFRGKLPTGTHHAIVTMTSTPQQIGNYPCQASSMDSEMIFAGGAGFEDITFPAGVAIKIPAGSYINLNLHLDNRTASPLSGTSGVLVKTVPAAMVQHEADMVFLGNMGYQGPILSNGQPTYVPADCGAPNDWHIFGFVPHMHDVAVHQTIEEVSGNTSYGMRLDTDYDVDAQHRYQVDFLLPQNHRLKIKCEYINNTGATRYIGDSAYQSEQCLAGMYRWPKGIGTDIDKYSCVTMTAN